MSNVSLKIAQDNLSELIHQLAPGEELVITENDQPIARIIATSLAKTERTLGTMAGSVTDIAPDFDAPLDIFREYMP